MSRHRPVPASPIRHACAFGAGVSVSYAAMVSPDSQDDLAAKSDALVVIPARGGSQGIKLKNLEPVGGVSLVGRAVDTARRASLVGRVVVSTDHDSIGAEAAAHGAEVIRRPSQFATNEASSESVLSHALSTVTESGIMPPVTVLLQCTSPFIDAADLDSAIAKVASGECDVAIAVSETHDFQWRLDVQGVAHPVGHPLDHRPRRQERDQHFRETGAFYAMSTEAFLAKGTRFCGRVALQPTPPEWSLEIDDPSDLERARELSQRFEARQVAPYAELAGIEVLVTDFDGVHTDDRAIVMEDGTEGVLVKRGDGLGMSELVKSGIRALILSTERNPVVAARARKLGVEVIHGSRSKSATLRDWLKENEIDARRVAYVGNDVNDLGAMALVGFPIAVRDARPEVKQHARLVLECRGGEGAVREVCDLLIRSVAQSDNSGKSTASLRNENHGRNRTSS